MLKDLEIVTKLSNFCLSHYCLRNVPLDVGYSINRKAENNKCSTLWFLFSYVFQKKLVNYSPISG